jgi:hypothetical protein
MDDAAKNRKAELEEKQADRKKWWLHKEEIRREERRRAEEEALEVTERDERRRHWLRCLCMVAVIENIHSGYVVAVENQRQMMLEVQSATVIQRFVLYSLMKKRKQRMYRQVVQLRLGLAAFVRHSRQASAAFSSPALKWFLEVFAYHKEAPSMKGALRSFKKNVLLVQRFYKRLRGMRMARVEVLESAWSTVHLQVMKAQREEAQREEEEKLHKSKRPASGSLKKSRKSVSEPAGEPEPEVDDLGTNSPTPPSSTKSPSGSPTGKGAAPSRPSGQSRADFKKTAPSVRYSMGKGSFVTELPEEEEPDPDVPAYIRKQVLLENVIKQQKTYDKRMKEYEQQKEEFERKNEVARFSGGIVETTTLKKPRPFEVDENELKHLISHTFVDWKEGKFKHIEQNRKRLIKKSFKQWMNALGYHQDQGSRRASPLPPK